MHYLRFGRFGAELYITDNKRLWLAPSPKLPLATSLILGTLCEKRGLKMEYKFIVTTYNNKDFTNTVYVNSQKEALDTKEKLLTLKHITDVAIVPPPLSPNSN